MLSHTFVERILKFTTGICFVVFGIVVGQAFGFNYNSPLGFWNIPTLLEVVGSFLGAISLAGFVASMVTQAFFDEGSESWWLTAVILMAWMVFLNLNSIPLPSQGWAYILGLALASLVTVSLSLALITVGPTFARIIGGITLFGSIAATLAVSYVSLSNQEALADSLKRVDINTPYEVIDTLEATEQSSAVEDSNGSFQPVPRQCEPYDVICVGVIDLYEIPVIAERLGMEDLNWRTEPSENHPNMQDIAISNAQYRQLDIIFAQSRDQTIATVIDLSKLSEEQRARTSFMVP